MSDGPAAWIARAERDAALRDPSHLRERLEAMDRLELYEEHAGDEELTHRAARLRTSLDAINLKLYAHLRGRLLRGENVFAPWIDALEPAPSGGGYDYRDDLVSGVLALEEPDEIQPLPPDMVFYQPTPARHVFDLANRAALHGGDTFVDLGSGLGIVPLTIAAATGARTIGIEREAAYVAMALRCARRLNTTRVSFECRDAREADWSQGTLFYLYTPFTGGVMRSVLDALKREAGRRPLRVATFGPCTRVVAAEPWLRADAMPEEDRIALFHIR